MLTTEHFPEGSHSACGGVGVYSSFFYLVCFLFCFVCGRDMQGDGTGSHYVAQVDPELTV